MIASPYPRRVFMEYDAAGDALGVLNDIPRVPEWVDSSVERPSTYIVEFTSSCIAQLRIFCHDTSADNNSSLYPHAEMDLMDCVKQTLSSDIRRASQRDGSIQDFSVCVDRYRFFFRYKEQESVTAGQILVSSVEKIEKEIIASHSKYVCGGYEIGGSLL